MRFDSARLILAGALGIAGCASGPGPTTPAEGTAPAPTAAVAATVAPEPSASATGASVTPPQAASGGAGCFAKPVTITLSKGAKATPLDPSLPAKLAACDRETDIQACRYKIARAYFDAAKYEEAGPLLREIALNAGSDPGIHAAQLYLESLNILGAQAEPARPACYDEMASDIGPLQAKHCGKGAKYAAELCDILRRIERDLQRKRAEEFVIQADKDQTGGATALYRKAGDAYMAIFNQSCAFRRPDAKHKPEPPPGQADARCDEIGYNAMRAYIAAKEPKLAEAARAALLSPDNQLHKGELAKRAAAMQIQ